MKCIKLFESFDKFSFEEFKKSDIVGFLIDPIERGILSVDEDSLINKREINRSMTSASSFVKSQFRFDKDYYENLFDKYTTDQYDLSSDFLYFEIGINHPKYKIRNPSFNIPGYSKSTIKNYLKRVVEMYNVDIFCRVISSNFMSNEISKCGIIIQEKTTN